VHHVEAVRHDCAAAVVHEVVRALDDVVAVEADDAETVVDGDRALVDLRAYETR
jgi:hypothetical protein